MLAATWGILLELAPWLLLGAAITGILHALLPSGFARRQLTGYGGVAKAVAVGVPLPLCSCGVIPAGLGLKRDGASNGAAVGFLISTPQTGVDSILVSASFLGMPFALFKVASATVTGLVGGWLTEAWAPSDTGAVEAPSGERTADRSVRGSIAHAIDVLRTIWRWLVFGVVMSAVITVLVPAAWFVAVAEHGVVVAALAALLISAPLYVCATASVPIAAALVERGFPPGAALVFLIAGPATNLATMGAVYRTLGPRVLGIYLGTIIVGSLGSAFFFDSVIALAVGQGHGAHHHGAAEGAWWAVASAVAFLGLLAWFAWEDAVRFWHTRRAASTTAPSVRVTVAGMTCQGCVGKVTRALEAAPGVESAVVTLEGGRAEVRGALTAAAVCEVIEKAGYRASPVGVPLAPQAAVRAT